MGKLKMGLWVVLTAMLIFTSSASATSTVNDVSRVVYFTVQSNTVCGEWEIQKYRCDFNFNVNNISDVSSDITVYLYKKDGTLASNTGITGYGFNSEITPSTMITIGPNQTVQYTVSYGYKLLECSERPAYGKIVVHSSSSLLMANGEMQGRRLLTTDNVAYWETYSEAPVTVNGGNPF